MNSKYRWTFALSAILIVGMWLAFGGVSRISAELNARALYLQSRGGNPNSASFISAGVLYGMTSDEVDALFAGRASFRGANFRLSDSNCDQAFENVYIWRHGSNWISCITKESTHFYEEWFFVRFNESGHAISLTRTIANVSDPRISRHTILNLKEVGNGDSNGS